MKRRAPEPTDNTARTTINALGCKIDDTVYLVGDDVPGPIVNRLPVGTVIRSRDWDQPGYEQGPDANYEKTSEPYYWQRISTGGPFAITDGWKRQWYVVRFSEPVRWKVGEQFHPDDIDKLPVGTEFGYVQAPGISNTNTWLVVTDRSLICYHGGDHSQPQPVRSRSPKLGFTNTLQIIALPNDHPEQTPASKPPKPGVHPDCFIRNCDHPREQHAQILVDGKRVTFCLSGANYRRRPGFGIQFNTDCQCVVEERA